MQEPVFSVEKLSLLFELSRSFSALIDLEELLSTIITKTKDILQAENCALLLKLEEASASSAQLCDVAALVLSERFRQMEHHLPAAGDVLVLEYRHGRVHERLANARR